MSRRVSLYNVVKRIEFAESMILKHPANEEMLKKNIERNKQYIAEIVIKNKDNEYLLNQITD